MARLTVENQRVGVAPMETNTVWARPWGAGVELWCSTQAPHIVRTMVATLVGLDEGDVAVHTVAVGGGFGAKSVADPEYVVAAALARRLNRPVLWRQSREENLLGMHARAQRQHVQLGATADGRLVGIRADLVADAGAYPAIGTYLPMLTRLMLSGVYRVDRIESTARCAATNTVPTTAFRGAGRPEAAHLVERAMDVLAAELDMDPVELRQRNLIPADAFPYRSPTGAVYDSGDYAGALDLAIAVAGYDDLRAEQARRRSSSDRWQLGIGVSTYVEVTANAGPSEYASVEVHTDGAVTVSVGTASHGQGHATTFAQIAAAALGVPHASIRVVSGDTALVPRGEGSYSSRSVQVGGSAVHVMSERLVERATALAAHLLEAALDDIVRHDDGGFGVAGVPSSALSWADLAEAAAGPLVEAGDWERPAATFPFGAHIAVVEVDVETGGVRWVDHVAVDDCGRVINPLLADGQVHGGIAQGGSQALFEQIVYDDDATPLTTSFSSYAVPSAAELPPFRTARTITLTDANPLGAKGIGESGTIGAMPAVHNAVVDAVAHLGVRHIDMPCTPERVWRAVAAARLAGGG
ncbi:MAG: molybdopterin-dependent oxidoreductase [Acidimicrobiales bacterium]|nr:molybdopterin-dependent oxidoreductase [Acidimicrobiales bacterium]